MGAVVIYSLPSLLHTISQTLFGYLALTDYNFLGSVNYPFHLSTGMLNFVIVQLQLNDRNYFSLILFQVPIQLLVYERHLMEGVLNK